MKDSDLAKSKHIKKSFLDIFTSYKTEENSGVFSNDINSSLTQRYPYKELNIDHLRALEPCLWSFPSKETNLIKVPSLLFPYLCNTLPIVDLKKIVNNLRKQIDDQCTERSNPSQKSDTKSLLIAATLCFNSSKAKDNASPKKSKKAIHQFHDDDYDDSSWDGSSFSDSDDHYISGDELGPEIEVIKEAEDNTLDYFINSKSYEDDSEISSPASVSDDYFDSAVAIFFIEIGNSLVQERMCQELINDFKEKYYYLQRISKNKIQYSKPLLEYLRKNRDHYKEKNSFLKLKQKKCKFCAFKSESEFVIQHHMNFPHKLYEYFHCNFCKFMENDNSKVLEHMSTAHGTLWLNDDPAVYQCANCPFENDSKRAFNNHLKTCHATFLPDQNLAPSDDWEPAAKRRMKIETNSWY